jgi:hypothetical protein
MGRAGFFTRCALVLLVGCSPVEATAPDGPGPDADLGGDATIVTEAALFGSPIGTKVGDIDIISMLPDNTVLAMAKTDAGGNATIRVHPGGTVTAVYRHTAPDMGADLITWAGVKPGDKLTFGNRQPSFFGSSTNLGSQTYAWPAQAGASTYYVLTSCNGGGVGAPTTSIAMSEFSSCHQEPMDVLFVATNAMGQPTHFSFRSNVAFASGGTVTAPAWSAAQTAQVTITGLRPEVTQLSGTFATVLDGVTEQNITGGYNGTPTGGAFTASFAWHPAGDRTVSLLFLGRPGFAGMAIYDSFAATTTTATVAAPALTPWRQGSVLASPALQTARWFLVSDPGSVHDGQLLRVGWSHNIGGTNHPHQWYFILPPDQTSFTFPKLPAQFSDNVPAPQDGMSSSIRVFDIPSVTGYDMTRTLPSSTVMCLECAVRAGDLPRVVFSE